MLKFALGAVVMGVTSTCLIAACSKKDETPPAAQPGQYPAQQGYPPAAGAEQYPQQPGYPAQQQPGYPAQQQPGYPPQQPGYPSQQPAAQPGYPAAPPAAGAPTSQPSPVAFPCQSDIQCLSHRCNVQVGKCSWPCQSNNDCQPGFQCVTPACVPALPQQ
jgi:hypothetical protein